MYTHTRVCTKRQIPVLPCSLRHTLHENHARTLKDAALAETRVGPTCGRAPCWPRSGTLISFTAQSGQGALIPSTPLPCCIVQAPNQAPGSDSPPVTEDQKDRATVDP